MLSVSSPRIRQGGEADLPSWGTKGTHPTLSPFLPRAVGTGQKGGEGVTCHPLPHESSAGVLEHRGARNKNHPLQGFSGRRGIANPANEQSWDCKSQRPVTIFRCPIPKILYPSRPIALYNRCSLIFEL